MDGFKKRQQMCIQTIYKPAASHVIHVYFITRNMQITSYKLITSKPELQNPEVPQVSERCFAKHHSFYNVTTMWDESLKCWLNGSNSDNKSHFRGFVSLSCFFFDDCVSEKLLYVMSCNTQCDHQEVSSIIRLLSAPSHAAKRRHVFSITVEGGAVWGVCC